MVKHFSLLISVFLNALLDDVWVWLKEVDGLFCKLPVCDNEILAIWRELKVGLLIVILLNSTL